MHQPATRGRSGRNLTIPHRVRAALIGTLAVAVLPLTAACGAGDDGEKDEKASKATAAAPAAVAPAKVEVIAAMTGCKPKIRIEADELREGVCHTERGDYAITTFPAEKYKKTWLESASVYGGKYLVGLRWVVSARPAMLEPLRTELGGTIQDLRGMSGPAPTTPGPGQSPAR